MKIWSIGVGVCFLSFLLIWSLPYQEVTYYGYQLTLVNLSAVLGLIGYTIMFFGFGIEYYKWRVGKNE